MIIKKAKMMEKKIKKVHHQRGILNFSPKFTNGLKIYAKIRAIKKGVKTAFRETTNQKPKTRARDTIRV
jgi:hypothetical protein